jgi:hypothetical protein
MEISRIVRVDSVRRRARRAGLMGMMKKTGKKPRLEVPVENEKGVEE